LGSESQPVRTKTKFEMSGNASLATHYILTGVNINKTAMDTIHLVIVVFYFMHGCKTWVSHIKGATKAERVRELGAGGRYLSSEGGENCVTTSFIIMLLAVYVYY
jgi:uncharacterized protein YceK